MDRLGILLHVITQKIENDRKLGGSARLTLEAGAYSVRWYNPRTGGALQTGTVQRVSGPGTAALGSPPTEPEKDWAVLLRRQ